MMKMILKKLDAILQLMLEEREERKAEKLAKEQEINDKKLMEYARQHNKRVPSGGVHSSRELGGRPVHSDGDLVPYGLSERDKALLDEFYNH